MASCPLGGAILRRLDSLGIRTSQGVSYHSQQTCQLHLWHYTEVPFRFSIIDLPLTTSLGGSIKLLRPALLRAVRKIFKQVRFWSSYLRCDLLNSRAQLTEKFHHISALLSP